MKFKSLTRSKTWCHVPFTFPSFSFSNYCYLSLIFYISSLVFLLFFFSKMLICLWGHHIFCTKNPSISPTQHHISMKWIGTTQLQLVKSSRYQFNLILIKCSGSNKNYQKNKVFENIPKLKWSTYVKWWISIFF